MQLTADTEIVVEHDDCEEVAASTRQIFRALRAMTAAHQILTPTVHEVVECPATDAIAHSNSDLAGSHGISKRELQERQVKLHLQAHHEKYAYAS